MMDLNKLKAPFPPAEVSWRIGQCGKTRDGGVWAKVLAYIDNRCIMDRLDEVVGPANWKNEYTVGPGGGVLCGLSIRILGTDGTTWEWVTKYDGAENSDIEAVKGGLSDAMKRAAVQWGVGRYLYELGENWAQIVDKKVAGAHYAKSKDAGEFYWLPPGLPAFAVPEGTKPKAKPNGKPAADDLPPIPPKKQYGPGDQERYVKLLTFIADCQDKEEGGVYRTRQQRLTDLRFSLMGKDTPWPALNKEQVDGLGKLIDQAVAAIECAQQPEFSR